MSDEQTPLTLSDCNKTLGNIFNAIGELEVKGKQSDIVAGIIKAIVAVNNGILAEMSNQEEIKKTITDKIG